MKKSLITKASGIKVIFFGNERLASSVTTQAAVFQRLIQDGYSIEYVVINQKETSGRKTRTPEIVQLAQKFGISVLYPGSDMRALIEPIKRSGAVIGVLVAFGRIVPRQLMDAFRYGILNIHPSLLPKYRGASPIETVILNGDSKTGVSIMKLAVEMDAGSIYAISEVKVQHEESKQSLSERLDEIGAEILSELLPRIISGELTELHQDEQAAVYTTQIHKIDGKINWSKPAIQLEREIRAYLGWPGSYTTIKNIDVIITKAHSVPFESSEYSAGDVEVLADVGALMVYCGQGYLCIERLKPAGRKEMSAEDFIHGYLK